jgi:hypothetical protein
MRSTHSGLRVVLVAIVIPLALTVIALIVSFSLAATLPASIPTHWNVKGEVDGYGSPYTYPIIIASVCLPFIAIFGGVVVLMTHRYQLTIMGKLLAVISVWLVVFLSIAMIGALLATPSITSGTVPAFRVVGWSLLVAFVVAVAAAVGAWFLLPRAARRTPGRAPAVAPIVLGEGERATWIRSTAANPRVILGLVGILLVVTAVCVLVVVHSDGRVWPIVIIPILLIGVALTNLAWTVRIDDTGVRARSAIGIPTITIHLADIASADVLDVNSFTEYGGWGFRWGFNGRMGVIVRSGEALEIRRLKGLSFVITIDDADSAAALINSLIARTGAASSSTAGSD